MQTRLTSLNACKPLNLFQPWWTTPVQVDRVTVPMADLPAHLEGLKVVQMSDFHFDRDELPEQVLAQAIAKANHAEPDLICLTGDFITSRPQQIHALGPWLQKLQSRYGVYAVLGNHDTYRKSMRHVIVEGLEAAGCTVLWNQVAYPMGPELAVVGLADFWSPQFNPQPVFAEIDPTVPRLVMSHNPDTAAVLQAWRVDLQLSGHTHGGQIRVPGIGNVAQQLAWWYRQLPKPIGDWIPGMRACDRVMRHWEWDQGLFKVGDNRLYVNRGLGSYPPGRFLCPPEVTVIQLTRSAFV